MNVVVVESPAKAKTINKYLGPDYRVLASYGHVRDLPSKDGSVIPEDDFTMVWTVDGDSQKRLKSIADALKDADKLILATDPDREGEAISWHVLEVLRQKNALKDVAVERVVFNAVTKKSVLDAMRSPRAIDRELVEAYLARRALDYLVGFTLSPVLWRKLPGSRSAGRVQSVALRLICDRELEIEKFRPQEYWTLEAELAAADGTPFAARLTSLEGRKLEKFDIADAEAAARAKALIERDAFAVSAVEEKPTRRNPYAPFTTSTLQQEAARKLGFSASQTMQVAQKLYEGVELAGETVGLITYMRTDGVQITNEAIADVRRMIERSYGDAFLPAQPRLYTSKARNAQEAHEAIRPTDVSRRPEEVARFLREDQRKLYDLIWRRTIASQMESARLERTTVDIASADGRVGLRATGQVLLFEGFLKLYQEGRDDSQDDEEGARLPKLKQGDRPTFKAATASQHFTEPPPRFTEATLVKKLEELGIGRPSTYAQTLSVLRDRAYVRMDRNRFVPEDKGRLVTAFLESFFGRYVEYDFTAGLEERLDEISAGKLAWKDFLRDFWTDFAKAVEEIKDLRVSEVLEALNELLGPHIFPQTEGGGDPRACPSCGDGRLSLKVGKFGAFIGCSNYPNCRYTRQLAQNGEEANASAEPKLLGYCPQTGLAVTLRTGRFGPYVQLGESEGGEKPKRASVPKDMDLGEINLDRALALLNLPRTVGEHPETRKPILAHLGRYGPYLEHDGATAKLDSSAEVFTVGLNRAVTLLAERKGKGPRPAAGTLRELGPHPEDGKPVTVKSGRFGPYVNHGKLNATLRKAMDPAAITLEEALALLAAKAEKMGNGAAPAGKGGGKKAKKVPAKATRRKAAKKATAADAPDTEA